MAFDIASVLLDDERKEKFYSEDQDQGGAEPWAEPIPLTGGMVSGLPQFPLDVIPSAVFRTFTQAVTDTVQVDAGMSGATFLAVLSLSLRGQADIELPTHKETVNLFLAIAASSGERKSETHKQFLSPIPAFLREIEIATAADRRKAINHKIILEKRIERLRKQASAMEGLEARKVEFEAEEYTRELDTLIIPGPPDLIVADATEEKIGQLLSLPQNRESLAMVSTEGGIFETMAGRYSSGHVAIDLYLKGHTGDPHQVHRIGRDPVLLTRPIITFALMVQPEVIRSLGGNQDFMGRGLLSRFLYVWATPKAGTRKLSKHGIPPEVRDAYYNTVQDLLRVDFGRIVTFELSPQAQRVWEAFYDESERCLSPVGELHDLKDWGSKLPGAVARIAGLFHFAEHGQESPYNTVSAENMEAAVTLGAYFADHARAVFAVMKEDAELAGARQILEALKRHGLRTFKERDILRTTSISKIADLKPGLEILSDRGWIRTISQSKSSGPGRPQGQTYETHPKVWA